MDTYKDFWGRSANLLRHVGYRPRSSIPNIEGLNVELLLLDDRIITTKVILEDGVHRLKDISILDVVGWKLAE